MNSNKAYAKMQSFSSYTDRDEPEPAGVFSAMGYTCPLTIASRLEILSFEPTIPGGTTSLYVKTEGVPGILDPVCIRGECFMIGQDKLLTAAHVVANATRKVVGGTECFIALIMRDETRVHKTLLAVDYFDVDRDVAILTTLQIPNAQNFPIQTINEGIPDVNNGEPIFVVKENGELCSFNARVYDGNFYFVGDGSFTEGASGAPIINGDGHVIAIVCGGYPGTGVVKARVLGDVNSYCNPYPSTKRVRESLPELPPFLAPVLSGYQPFGKKYAAKVVKQKNVAKGGSDVWQKYTSNFEELLDYEVDARFDYEDALNEQYGVPRDQRPGNVVAYKVTRTDGRVVVRYTANADEAAFKRSAYKKYSTLDNDISHMPAGNWIPKEAPAGLIQHALGCGLDRPLKGHSDPSLARLLVETSGFVEYLGDGCPITFQSDDPVSRVQSFTHVEQLRSAIYAFHRDTSRLVAVLRARAEAEAIERAQAIRNDEDLESVFQSIALLRCMLQQGPTPQEVYAHHRNVAVGFGVPDFYIDELQRDQRAAPACYEVLGKASQVSQQYREDGALNPAVTRAAAVFPELGEYHFGPRDDHSVFNTLQAKNEFNGIAIFPAAREAAAAKLRDEHVPRYNHVLAQDGYPSVEAVWRCVNEINPHANDSYPGSLLNRPKLEFAIEFFPFVLYQVYAFITAWQLVPDEAVNTLTPLELYMVGMSFMSTIAPKKEVVKVGKPTRLIFRATAAGEVLKRLYYSDAYVVPKENPGATHSMIGFSPTPAYGAMLHQLPGVKASTDVSGFDFVKTLEDKMAEAELMIHLNNGITDANARVVRGIAWSDAHTISALPNGYVVARRTPGSQSSGEFDTSMGNTFTRAAWGYAAHEYIKAVFDPSHEYGLLNASDDAVETHHEFLAEVYLAFGVPIRDYESYAPGTPIEFCSHYWPAKGFPYPKRIWKAFYKLAAGGYQAGPVDDFVREFTPHPDFVRVWAYMQTDPAFRRARAAANAQ